MDQPVVPVLPYPPSLDWYWAVWYPRSDGGNDIVWVDGGDLVVSGPCTAVLYWVQPDGYQAVVPSISWSHSTSGYSPQLISMAGHVVFVVRAGDAEVTWTIDVGGLYSSCDDGWSDWSDTLTVSYALA